MLGRAQADEPGGETDETGGLDPRALRRAHAGGDECENDDERA